MASTLRVHAEFDLRDLARDLDSVALGLGREVNAEIREAAGLVARAAPRYTPYDPQHRSLRHDKNGQAFTVPHMRDTFEARTAGTGAAVITSTHPAAAVFEFGGHIAPKGRDIIIREHGMAAKAADAQAATFERALARRLDALAARHGL